MTETETEPVTVTPEVVAHRAAWVAALRSGDYAQTNRVLRRDDGYCCLGVAEDVRGAAWRELPPDELADLDGNATHVLDDPTLEDWQYLVMTDAGRRWYGLASGNPYVAYRAGPDVGWETLQLSELNDDRGLSLAAIADVLEAQPAGWTGDLTQVAADVAARRRAAHTTEEDS